MDIDHVQAIIRQHDLGKIYVKVQENAFPEYQLFTVTEIPKNSEELKKQCETHQQELATQAKKNNKKIPIKIRKKEFMSKHFYINVI